MTEATIERFDTALASHNRAELLAGRNLALFYDTETTSMPLFKEPSEDPRQPHIVQLAALLVDLDKREVIDGMDVIVKPEGWEIPHEVSLIHGITHEYALEHGIPERDAVGMLLGMWGCQAGAPVQRIGHGEPFDARILRIALKRYFGDAAADAWKAARASCTLKASRPLVKAVDKNGKGKAPTLTEAYTHFFGEPFAGAHGALADARACMDVHFSMVDLAMAQAA